MIFISYTQTDPLKFPNLRGYLELTNQQGKHIREYFISSGYYVVCFSTDVDKYNEWVALQDDSITFKRLTEQEAAELIYNTPRFQSELQEYNERRAARLKNLRSKVRGLEFDSDEIAMDRFDRIITLKTAHCLKALSEGKTIQEAYKDNFNDFFVIWHDYKAEQQVLSTDDLVVLQLQNLYNMLAVWAGITPEQAEQYLSNLKNQFGGK